MADTRSTKPRLDRERVVAGAVRLLDAEGADALSFRRLAADLDAGLATLHWHVPKKDLLMELAMEAVLVELDERAAPPAPSHTPWDVQLRDDVLALWSILTRHPWAAHQAIVSGERSPALLRHWDRAAALLLSAGLSPERTFYTLSTLRTFVLGSGMEHAIRRVHGDEQDAAAAASAVREYWDTLPADAYPSFHQLLPELAAHDEETELLRGLDLILRDARC